MALSLRDEAGGEATTTLISLSVTLHSGLLHINLISNHFLLEIAGLSV